MPDRKRFKTNEEYNAWYRDYREKNRAKILKYKREWARKKRANKAP